ncbi:hypothetical protein BDV12DRAFT_190221 [Aspergillus spectabilis]
MSTPDVYQLSVASAFGSLTKQEKLYAHFIANVPEANGIFDFILALYRSCKGDWERIATEANIEAEELSKFLDYAALFLSSIGNYFGSGDQKFVPGMFEESLTRLASTYPLSQKLPPNNLGPSVLLTQITYYLGDDCLSSNISSISRLMEDLSIHSENNRLERYQGSRVNCYDFLQASVDESIVACDNTTKPPINNKRVRLVRGDHREELEKICKCLRRAYKYGSNSAQKQLVQKTMDSFLLGDLELYKGAQRIWMNDKSPAVETVLGFVEPYRDRLGVRAEFEGIVGILDPAETELLRKLAEVADTFVSKLPIIFPGINLPNYNDIRQEMGYKNIIFSNRMGVERAQARGLQMVAEPEQETYQRHRFHSYYIWAVLHEILGHGTERFLAGQNWTGVFGDLPTTVDECRGELMGAYLIDKPDILALSGYTEQSEVKPEDLVYNMYLQLGVDGLWGLENYDPLNKKWGQAHSRAHLAIFRHLLRGSNGLYTVHCDPQSRTLTVKVDRAHILDKGKPSLRWMLSRLHVYRCTADIANCREFYESLSHVDDEALKWRDAVIFHKDSPLAFCQANTYLNRDQVELKEYDSTARGIIQSWAERDIL